MIARARTFRLIERYHPRFDGTALVTFADALSDVRSVVVYHAQIMMLAARPCGQLLIHGWFNQRSQNLS